jgi:hypothetical protein
VLRRYERKKGESDGAKKTGIKGEIKKRFLDHMISSTLGLT